MKMIKKIICLDLDNVICFTNKERNYKKSKPNLKAIKTINLLYQRGHTIKIFTARGMEKFKGKQSLVKKKYFNFTKKQLYKWGVNYHELILGKPSYDIFIDDKSYRYSVNWKNYLLRKFK